MGYSSLSYLKQLPVDVLKIDRSFVTGIPGDAGDRGIVKAILALALNLKMEVIAEGVEARAQLEALAEYGCEAFQGFYFDSPQAAETLSDRLSSRGEPTARKDATAHVGQPQASLQQETGKRNSKFHIREIARLSASSLPTENVAHSS